jgi:hypothetical protein
MAENHSLRWRRMLLSIALLLLLLHPQLARAQAVSEYQVKAAFLYNFAKFVDWPAGALNATDQIISLCVFDDEPRLQELLSFLEGKSVGTRTLHVRLLSQVQAAQGCNVLFLSHDESLRQAAVLKSLRGQPVLTVGETDNFLSGGGMIRLRLDEDKIRFDINAGAADSSHLKISSRLLMLATTVTLGGERDRRR